MSHLNLLDKAWHTIEVKETTGESATFKIPVELNVAEQERILAIYDELDKLQDELTTDDGSAQLRLFWDKIFAMCMILFQHYQPEITESYLRLNLTSSDALAITNFFNSNRYMKTKMENEEQTKKAEADL